MSGALALAISTRRNSVVLTAGRRIRNIERDVAGAGQSPGVVLNVGTAAAIADHLISLLPYLPFVRSHSPGRRQRRVRSRTFKADDLRACDWECQVC